MPVLGGKGRTYNFTVIITRVDRLCRGQDARDGAGVVAAVLARWIDVVEALDEHEDPVAGAGLERPVPHLQKQRNVSFVWFPIMEEKGVNLR